MRVTRQGTPEVMCADTFGQVLLGHIHEICEGVVSISGRVCLLINACIYVYTKDTGIISPWYRVLWARAISFVWSRKCVLSTIFKARMACCPFYSVRKLTTSAIFVHTFYQTACHATQDCTECVCCCKLIVIPTINCYTISVQCAHGRYVCVLCRQYVLGSRPLLTANVRH